MVRVSSPTFVGRSAELAALDEALDAAEQGQTTTVLIGGDPGVGKSRLLDEWNGRARARGARLAVGSCVDLGETGPAYAAVVEALRDLLGGLDPAEEQRLVGGDRSAVARVVPELALAVDPAHEADAPHLAQARLFIRLVDVIQRMAAKTPIVLELEDIHWADPSTRAFLLYLAEMSRDARLLVVGTYRPEDSGTDPAFRSALTQMLRRPRVSTIVMSPFDRAELRDLLTGIRGARPSNALLTAVHERSEGNALFAEELAAADDPEADLPASVRAATATKMTYLSAAGRAVLRAAAVAGRTATYDLLRLVTGFGDIELADALRESVEAGLLEPHHAGEGYRFRHELIQEAIYAETLPGERRRLHAAVALALADDPDSPPADGDLAPRLALHFYEAHEYDRAFRASRAAAAAAERQSAYIEALGHYERLLELWDQPTIARGDVTRASIHERAARSAYLAGELPRSAIHGRQALVDLDDTPDDSVKIRVLDQLARTLGTVGEDGFQVIAQIAAMDPGERPLGDRIMVLAHRARKLRNDGDPATALAMARPLPALALSANDPSLLARATMLLGELLDQQDPDESIRLLKSARELAARSGDVVLEVDLGEYVVEILLASHRYEEVLVAAQAAIEIAGSQGFARVSRPYLRFQQAWACLRLGRLTESLEKVELGLSDDPKGTALSSLHLVGAQAATASGFFEDAAAHLEAARSPSHTEDRELDRGYLATARADLAMAEGRFDDSERIIQTTAPRVAARDRYNEESVFVWWLAERGLATAAELSERARAANDRGSLGRLSTFARSLTGYVEAVHKLRDRSGVPDLGQMDRYELLVRGHLARIEDRDDPGLWVEAAAAFPPQSVESLTARSREAEAMLATRATRDEVAAVMAPAHAAAVAIGARPLANRFEALARRVRIDLRVIDAEVVPTDEALGGLVEAPLPGSVALRQRRLSDREIEVLTLVASGYSNPEIGERLYISTKTASVHVSHILDKLGVSTRTEAATIGVRLGLPEVAPDEP